MQADEMQANRPYWNDIVKGCIRLEAASDVISRTFVGPIVPNKPVEFRDPRLNCSREFPPEAVGGGIFDSFFRITSDPNRH